MWPVAQIAAIGLNVVEYLNLQLFCCYAFLFVIYIYAILSTSTLITDTQYSSRYGASREQ